MPQNTEAVPMRTPSKRSVLVVNRAAVNGGHRPNTCLATPTLQALPLALVMAAKDGITAGIFSDSSSHR
jgi:hypothetical protein